MAVQEIDIRGTTAADPAAVWRLLGDSPTWPDWTPVESCEIVTPGGVDGIGEIRVFTTGRIRVREEIVERDPPRRLTYVLRAGLAVRDYRAEIDLTPRPEGGTDMRWHTTFSAKVAILGPLYRHGLRKATQRFVDGLAEAA